ncbi:hypothetical protein [Tabrizicola thermarum]|uniref:hypothetical protein n=1 Tax=Tabrizicola thermarum TaxID=2670345 RepID=UPI000FFC7D58|nr:hypothetical protein [Tabrizicola thermarum]
MAETLKAISEGVAEAQDHSRKSAGIPIGLHSVGDERVKAGEQLVKFTVSIQAEKTAERTTTGSIGATLISVVSGKVDASAASASNEASVHSVEFSVPMYFDSRWKNEGK